MRIILCVEKFSVVAWKLNKTVMTDLKLAVGMKDFCIKLYGIYVERGGNMFLSPFSISAALLLADLGADGETEKQIRAVLSSGTVSKDEIHRQYKQLEIALNVETSGTTTLSIANRIFSKLGLTVDEGYKVKSKEFYGSGIELLDFDGGAENSRLYINKWVEGKTRNKIRDLLPVGAIESRTLLVLVNAIYFKGKWLKPFNSYSTEKGNFFPAKSETIEVDMMNGQERVKYVLDENVGYSAVELLYKDGNIAMILILPKEVEGLADIEKQLESGLMTDISKKLRSAECPEVILRIPKFKMETTYELKDDLPKLGIIDMFNRTAANFSSMLPNTPEAFISSAIHKAFIKVDEEGTEAAAATAMIMTCFAMPLEQPKQFIADHPFIFLIRDTKSESILFMGRYVTPP